VGGDAVREHEGTRLPDGTGWFDAEPGDYWRIRRDGEWLWKATDPVYGMVAALDEHEVTEHDDGTITVSPSILIHGGERMKDEFHGYLKHGVWSW
jgi:hypothetical protein